VRHPPASGKLTITSSYRKTNAQLEDYLKTLPVGDRIRRRSAFKFADVARGSADLYPGFGLSYEWDTAAGHALVSAAGGSVTLVDGSSCGYGKQGFRNTDFVAFGAR
jgi:3'(2'), 5'-bisphosphate nucleotidase